LWCGFPLRGRRFASLLRLESVCSLLFSLALCLVAFSGKALLLAESLLQLAPPRRGGYFLCCCKESNCIEGQARVAWKSGFVRRPWLGIAHHGIELSEQLAHASDECHLGFLALVAKPIAERLDVGVDALSGDTRHI
jgi:hypothetical protein